MRSGNSVASSTRRAIERDLSFGKRKADAPYVTSSGPWRDVVMVDVLTANGQEFKGTIKHKEATKDIYQKALGLDRENLHGLKIEFRGHPVISFRLRSQINIDTAFTTDGFSFTRKMGEEEIVIEGKVRGVRDKSSAQPTFQKDVATRVKVKNCKWELMESDINAWLEQYGEITLPLSEETYSDDSDSDEDELGTGSYWLKMKLAYPIPQFLPMWGKKIEIYYRGMSQLCMKCYQPGHKRNDCQGEKVEWMDYVCDFIDKNEEYFDRSMYGKWFSIAKKHARNRPQNNVNEKNIDAGRESGKRAGDEQDEQEQQLQETMVGIDRHEVDAQTQTGDRDVGKSGRELVDVAKAVGVVLQAAKEDQHEKSDVADKGADLEQGAGVEWPIVGARDGRARGRGRGKATIVRKTDINEQGYRMTAAYKKNIATGKKDVSVTVRDTGDTVATHTRGRSLEDK